MERTQVWRTTFVSPEKGSGPQSCHPLARRTSGRHAQPKGTQSHFAFCVTVFSGWHCLHLVPLGYTRHLGQACVPGAQEMSAVAMHTLQEGAGAGHLTQHTGFSACGDAHAQLCEI